ncbi:12137_t:CDS:2 [Entrophospora sp. SA101]|nr:12137_t:CDS:2 [Entrophospora sp. SA101]
MKRARYWLFWNAEQMGLEVSASEYIVMLYNQWKWRQRATTVNTTYEPTYKYPFLGPPLGRKRKYYVSSKNVTTYESVNQTYDAVIVINSSSSPISRTDCPIKSMFD